MDPSLSKLLDELDRPRNRARLRRSIDAAGTLVRVHAGDAIAVLRDPAWDRPADLVGRWGLPSVKQILWKALLVDASADEVLELWFLADHADVDHRADFIADALSLGHREQLEPARHLLGDPEQTVREHTAIGLRNALRVTGSGAYASVVAGLLFDYVVAYPNDTNIARMMALRSVDADRAARAQRMIDESQRPSADGDWYVLAGSDLGWGDYGSILVHGIAGRLGRDDQARIRLQRTGPFVPPVTLAGLDVLLVTAAARASLESSGLCGIRFGPVELARVVRVAWHEWDLDAPEPEVYPPAGEPEAYILGRRHDAGLASAMPEIFEVVVDELTPADPPGDVDLYRRGTYQLVASRRAREWIEARGSRWIQFRDPPW